jgi:isoquinoline 1-oxidoreductase beta subunit
LAALAAGTGVLAIGWGVMPPASRLNPAKPSTAIDKTSALNGWVRIGEDDSVTVVMGKSEMGQGVFTGLGVLLAEELDARWDQVRFEQSPNDNIYNNLAGVADGLPFHPDNQGMVKSSAQWLVRKAMREMGLMFDRWFNQHQRPGGCLCVRQVPVHAPCWWARPHSSGKYRPMNAT